MRARLALAVLAFAGEAAALDSAQWPPPQPVEARMRELQHVIASRESSAAQRESARKELAAMLKSPAGRDRPTPREAQKRPARAAIDPLPGVVRPPDATPLPVPPGVARVEVVPPPRVTVDPRSGAAVAPNARFAIDPRTGAVLHETPGGYVDPATGRFIPR